MCQNFEHKNAQSAYNLGTVSAPCFEKIILKNKGVSLLGVKRMTTLNWVCVHSPTYTIIFRAVNNVYKPKWVQTLGHIHNYVIDNRSSCMSP